MGFQGRLGLQGMVIFVSTECFAVACCVRGLSWCVNFYWLTAHTGCVASPGVIERAGAAPGSCQQEGARGVAAGNCCGCVLGVQLLKGQPRGLLLTLCLA